MYIVCSARSNGFRMWTSYKRKVIRDQKILLPALDITIFLAEGHQMMVVTCINAPRCTLGCPGSVQFACLNFKSILLHRKYRSFNFWQNYVLVCKLDNFENFLLMLFCQIHKWLSRIDTSTIIIGATWRSEPRESAAVPATTHLLPTKLPKGRQIDDLHPYSLFYLHPPLSMCYILGLATSSYSIHF